MRSSPLFLLVACSTAATHPATAPAPVTPGVESAADPLAAEARALDFDIGANEGCLLRDGRLVCWGTYDESSEPVPPLDVRDPDARLVVSEGTVCVIDAGVLRCFGALAEEERYRAIEEAERSGATEEELEALDRGPHSFDYDSEAVDVAIAIGSLCWVRRDGSVRCRAAEGELAPEPPASLRDARRIAMTDDHACVIRAGGSVACWGGDAAGVGAVVSAGEVVVHEGLDAASIVAGLGFTCVRSSRGVIRCWGDGLLDEEILPDGSEQGDAGAPIYEWPDVRAVDLDAGDLHACASTASGRVLCMGDNGVGQLGDGTTRRRSSPVEATELRGGRALGVGHNTTCAEVDGALRCVGDGTTGSLGGGRAPRQWARVFTGSRSMFFWRGGAPCSVDERDRVECVGGMGDGGLIEAIRRRPPEGLPQTARDVVALDGIACWLEDSGTLRCADGPHAPPPRSDVAQVESGSRALCVRHVDGEVECFASRFGGSQLVSGPGWQRVEDFRGAVRIAVGPLGQRACAVVRSGRVRCLGIELGDLESLTDAVDVVLGASQPCVVRRDGTARCRTFGGTIERADVAEVVFFEGAPCFRKVDGTLEHVPHRGDPLNAPVADLVALEVAGPTLCVRTGAGEVWCHGHGLQGQLGTIPEGIHLEATTLDPDRLPER